MRPRQTLRRSAELEAGDAEDAIEAEVGRGTAVHAGGLEHRLESEVARQRDRRPSFGTGTSRIHGPVVDVRDERREEAFCGAPGRRRSSGPILWPSRQARTTP